MGQYVEWHGCYDGNMKGLTTRLSARHPAKMSRKLCERIFEYGEKMGYWKPGDLILDPFYGIGTTGIVGAYRGYRVVGVELEQYFFDLYDGCECTGVTADDWLRFYWRPAAGAYKDGRHWCPQCQADMAEVDENRQPPIFATPSAEYRRESFKIPSRPAHRYPGNRELNLAKWQARGLPVPVAIKGDSRKLSTLLREAAKGSVTSPPFAANSGGTGEASSAPMNAKYPGVWERHQGSMKGVEGYGGSDGQINAMPQGDVKDVIKGSVTSPPFTPPTDRDRYSTQAGEVSGFIKRAYTIDRQTRSEDNIAALPIGEVESTIRGGVTSSPYEGGGHHPDQINAWGGQSQSVDKDRAGYGQTLGQIGQMPQGEPPMGGVTSPPYGETDIAAKSGNGSYGDDFARTGQSPRALDQMAREKYGDADGQLAALPMGEVQDKDNGETYWSALAQVYSEVLAVFAPGAVLGVVVKNFVRDGVVVDLVSDMERLLVAIGFEYIERINALLVKRSHLGTNIWDGEDEFKVTERISFFRRLQNKRNPAAKISWESVIFVRKSYD